MITMPLQDSDISHPQRWPAKRAAAAGRVKRHGPTRQPVAPTAATRLPQRPDASVLSETIPLFFIGQNKGGFWVARNAGGGVGGIFLLKQSGLQFANTNAQPWGMRHNVHVGTLRTRHREQRQSACRSPWGRKADRLASCAATSCLRRQVGRSWMDGHCTVLNGFRRTTHASGVDRGRTLPQPLQALVQERRRFADRAMNAGNTAT
jgi:hypothetical protein